MEKEKIEYLKTSIKVDKNKYKDFQELCKINHSDVSKELRKFIENYVKKHSIKKV